MGGYIYIMTNKKMGTLYIGVTSDLIVRISQHKNGTYEGFTKKYKLHTLVYYEAFDGIESAIAREKQLKEWNRNWKLRLIIEKNPHWIDLWNEINGLVPHT
jgi:putative endonuclease